MKREVEVRELVRSADPVRLVHGEDWSESEEARRILATVLSTDAEVGSARSRRPRRIVAVAAALLLVGGGIAGASSYLFGQPAPEAIKRDLAGVDRGLPADIRLNPDVENARAVASTGSTTLYLASLKDGGHCTEIAMAGAGPRGAVCSTGRQVGSQPIEVTVPYTVVGNSSAVSVGGRVNAADVSSLEIRYADGQSDPIPFGDDRYFVFDVPSEHLSSVQHNGFQLVAFDSSGEEVTRAPVPAVDEESAPPPDEGQPIYVETTSNGDDFTQVLGIHGRVNAPGAASLELRYPDGTVVQIPLLPDGKYRYDVPASRQGDLYDEPGALIARNRSGDVVATAPVASVAWWEARNR